MINMTREQRRQAAREARRAAAWLLVWAAIHLWALAALRDALAAAMW